MNRTPSKEKIIVAHHKKINIFFTTRGRYLNFYFFSKSKQIIFHNSEIAIQSVLQKNLDIFKQTSNSTSRKPYTNQKHELNIVRNI